MAKHRPSSRNRSNRHLRLVPDVERPVFAPVDVTERERIYTHAAGCPECYARIRRAGAAATRLQYRIEGIG